MAVGGIRARSFGREEVRYPLSCRLPRQLIVDTEIGTTAATNYGATQGLSAAEFLKRRWDVPLDTDKVGAAIVSGLRGDIADGVTAIGVTGEGVEPLE
jgi:hypothetical protein